MNDTPLSVKAEVVLREEFLSDVMITAFDANYGGCWYWSRPADRVDSWADITDNPNVWRRVFIDVHDDEESVLHVVDHTILARGMQAVLDAARDGNYLELAAQILAQEGGDIDADAADIIVQYGLFGEVVYG